MKTKLPKRVKAWLNAYPDGGLLTWKRGKHARAYRPRGGRTVRVVELRRGEVVVDVEALAVMATNHAFDFPDRWDASVSKWHQQFRAALKKVGVR